MKYKPTSAMRCRNTRKSFTLFQHCKLCWPPACADNPTTLSFTMKEREFEVAVFLNWQFPRAPHSAVPEFVDLNDSMARLVGAGEGLRNPWPTCGLTMTSLSSIAMRWIPQGCKVQHIRWISGVEAMTLIWVEQRHVCGGYTERADARRCGVDQLGRNVYSGFSFGPMFIAALGAFLGVAPADIYFGQASGCDDSNSEFHVSDSSS